MHCMHSIYFYVCIAATISRTTGESCQPSWVDHPRSSPLHGETFYDQRPFIPATHSARQASRANLHGQATYGLHPSFKARYRMAGITADSDSRTLEIRRHSTPELEFLSTRHPTKQNPSSHGRGITIESIIAQQQSRPLAKHDHLSSNNTCV
ncbi:hypothetical protein CDL15_Pgr003899 [Punica granatum]|uniref:Secreted protein n=1 Tax=Punica granatum TaxID=22663 RepID=A0A218WRD5_PUNGR|nr:hypothetical protein CDL15_Pgr003899 [Punica granatum]